MDRRFLFPLAAGLVVLVGIAPGLLSEPSAVAVGMSPARATTTSADPDAGADQSADQDGDAGTDSNSGSGDGSSTGSSGKNATGTSASSSTRPQSGSGSGSGKTSSTTCDPPVTDRGPAPQLGDGPQTHEAGEAGSVDVERLSDSELRIVNATPNDGWQEQVKVLSGPRVTVRFDRPGESPSLIRFAASMDQKGTEIHIRVTSCG